MSARAEYALGKAIRKGQAEGSVATRADGAAARDLGDKFTKVSPSRIFANGYEQGDVYAMADGVSEEEFEEALADAREDRNLSRANVVRKIKALPTTAVRWEMDESLRGG